MKWNRRTKMITLFCAFHLFILLFIHRPEPLKQKADQFFSQNLSPMNHWRIQMASWALHRYAYFVGLDNTWKMYSYAHRMNWNYRWFAENKDGKLNLLPIPFQGERSWLDRWFFEFHEGKLNLNLYEKQDLRIRYAHYLCRQYPFVEASRTESIYLEREVRNIVDRTQAKLTGSAWAPEVNRVVLEIFRCAAQ